MMAFSLQHSIYDVASHRDQYYAPLFTCMISEIRITVLYADDTSVLIHGKDMYSIITAINHELKKLSTWLKANK